MTVRPVFADSTIPTVSCTNLSPCIPEAAGSRSSAMARWKSSIFLLTKYTESGSYVTVVVNASLDTCSSPCRRGQEALMSITLPSLPLGSDTLLIAANNTYNNWRDGSPEPTSDPVTAAMVALQAQAEAIQAGKELPEAKVVDQEGRLHPWEKQE